MAFYFRQKNEFGGSSGILYEDDMGQDDRTIPVEKYLEFVGSVRLEKTFSVRSTNNSHV